MAFPLLSLIVFAPFAAVLVLLCIPEQRKTAIRMVSLLGAIVSLVGSIVVAATYDRVAMGMQFAESYPLVPSLGIRFDLAADGWSVVLLVLTGIIIVAGVCVSWTVEERPREFFIFLLVLVAGVYGVFVCQDLFVFFLFYEIAVLPNGTKPCVFGGFLKNRLKHEAIVICFASQSALAREPPGRP